MDLSQGSSGGGVEASPGSGRSEGAVDGAAVDWLL